ncbi:hypothetical protein BDV93DRAFT_606446 [Ceratobasidium sp. AG-I]|nr:hypothetical protein BDV93DRAFT_606446 [Ceratobasidium sp. AG-I]
MTAPRLVPALRTWVLASAVAGMVVGIMERTTISLSHELLLCFVPSARHEANVRPSKPLNATFPRFKCSPRRSAILGSLSGSVHRHWVSIPLRPYSRCRPIVGELRFVAHPDAACWPIRGVPVFSGRVKLESPGHDPHGGQRLEASTLLVYGSLRFSPRHLPSNEPLVSSWCFANAASGMIQE